MRKIYIVIVGIVLFAIWYQFGRFKETRYVPEYEKIEISNILYAKEITKEEYEVLFYQTGLSKTAIDTLIKAGKEEVIKEIQEDFFANCEMEYEEVFGTIVLENIESEKEVSEDVFFAVQAGDIIMTHSVHTLGYYHGHIGIAINQDWVVAATAIGEVSKLIRIENWSKFSDYVILRPVFDSQEQKDALLQVVEEQLINLPYRLCVGLEEDKFVEKTEIMQGVHCSYLVWYAFYQVGIDLDSDGGKIVTPNDIYESDLLNILQVYGKNPALLTNRVCGTLGTE